MSAQIWGLSAPSAGKFRLLHHSEIIVIRGDSYRLLEKRKEGLLTSARAVGTALTD